MNDYPPTGSTVITTVELRNKTRTIPINTVGLVIAYTPTNLIKVDLGEYGTKFVAIQAVEMIDYPLPDELIGMTLIDLTQELIELVCQLKDALNEAQMLTPSRLAKITHRN